MMQSLTQTPNPREGAMALYRGLVKEGNKSCQNHRQRINPSCSERERLQVLDYLSLLPPRSGKPNSTRICTRSSFTMYPLSKEVTSRHLGLYARKRKKILRSSHCSEPDRGRVKSKSKTNDTIRSDKVVIHNTTRKQRGKISLSSYQGQNTLRKFHISKSLSLRNEDYLWHPVHAKIGQQKTNATHDVMKYYHRQYHKGRHNEKKSKKPL